MSYAFGNAHAHEFGVGLEGSFTDCRNVFAAYDVGNFYTFYGGARRGSKSGYGKRAVEIIAGSEECLRVGYTPYRGKHEVVCRHG